MIECASFGCDCEDWKYEYEMNLYFKSFIDMLKRELNFCPFCGYEISKN